jgi:cytochrome c oxidase subunit 1
LIFLAVAVLCCMKKGEKAPMNPWNAPEEDLEWTVPSPAPFHTFDTPPVIK